MPRWSHDEEKELVKLRRLGLNVVASKMELSGELCISDELPSLEDVLKILSGAIYKVCQVVSGKLS